MSATIDSVWPGLDAPELPEDDDAATLTHYREALRRGDRRLFERFNANEDVETLVCDRARLVDALLIRAWRRHAASHQHDLALVAVGGYGRGELHPCSDIDVMVLMPDDDAQCDPALESFFTFLWDIGLEIGHSVRTVADCRREARADISVTTSLMESRLLCGPPALFRRMQAAVGPDSVWPPARFFEAKLEEQRQRHHRYHDTGYNLEPNVKGSPGGLRDIQMIGWVTKRHFGARRLRELVDHDFLTPEEYGVLRAGQAFLWRVRFALHMLAGRREDRLLFDQQIRVASLFGYRDKEHNLAVEQLMQRYYRTVIELTRLNEMLLQLFREAILNDPQAPPVPLTSRFQVRNGYLETTAPDVFTRHPSALLEVFVLWQRHPELHGVSASAIRQIRGALPLIDRDFRRDPANHRLFLQMLSAPRYVAHALRSMNVYGVLGRYIPVWERIVGRMQYDLFHAYTVDAHTLFVVENLRRFARRDPRFGYCADVMARLPRPELAYLAALFHDVAKGRGGDHSELGAADAESFCLEQGLSRYEARMVAWLVKHHLLLSITSQKKDISDPQVIHDFAATVGDESHLDYLFVLTVADVRGTNPKLWNSWKASLFEELHLMTHRALRRGLENPIDREELIEGNQRQALALLAGARVDDRALREVWQRLGDDYFLRHSPEEVAWHTRVLIDTPAETPARVAIQRQGDMGGTGVLVYCPQRSDTFASATAVLDEMGLNILDARITRTRDGHCLDTYRVLTAGGEPITEPTRVRQMEQALQRAVEQPPEAPVPVTRRASRRVRVFTTPTRIEFVPDEHNDRTVVELVAADRPGLLSKVGREFVAAGIEIQTAKITTVGERAEDVFFVTDAAGRPLAEARCSELHSRLTEALA